LKTSTTVDRLESSSRRHRRRRRQSGKDEEGRAVHHADDHPAAVALVEILQNIFVSSSLTIWPNKLERVSSPNLFQSSLIFESKPELPKVVHLKDTSLFGRLQALFFKY